MKTYQFKSNINCTGCLAKVTPILNQEDGIEEWQVNLEHEDRILTVETEDLDQRTITEVVGRAGFIAEPIGE